MIGWLVAIGRMVGLGSVAGLRPSLTLAVIGVLSNLEWGAEVNSTFSFLEHWSAIAIFVVLAILESSIDKIPKLDRLQDRLILPYRLFMGGVAGAATIPFGWKGIVIGALLGGLASWFAQDAKHLTRPRTVSSDAVVALLSSGEDLVTFVGSTLTLVVPFFGYACAGVTTMFYVRVRGRRRAKYKRLRRVAQASQKTAEHRVPEPPQPPERESDG